MKPIQNLTFVILMLLGAYSWAQTGIRVTYYDGNIQNFNVTTSGKLYFSADNLYVKADGVTTSTTIPVNIIRKITFDGALATTNFGENDQALTLAPNPSADVIRIGSENRESLKTQIYSLTGQLILQGVYQVGQDIDVSKLAAGLYLVQVNGVTIKFSKK
ncbi:T9SS type A sorting domain-containing protein [Flavobacterium sp. CYK-4]|uniref:T9SS type A sorting domain-containing protein n=1 Tax=Flavobacterium lotistagni TaxID=2709660 RepID=UPI00140902BA|nr:T9SS type A sorting domain-containing protein [Flavobacterium lotistagni]NHM05849.1 T9SS type A sorting domain-containing protein [Flavobacterium lotistagni]